MLLILTSIIYWQIREIDRILGEGGAEAEGIDLALLSHISPIAWDNIVLYGEYQLRRNLVRGLR